MENRLVKRGSENILAVGREFDERYGRIVVVDERLDARAGARVPNAAQAVVRGGHDERAVAVEVHRRDLRGDVRGGEGERTGSE